MTGTLEGVLCTGTGEVYGDNDFLWIQDADGTPHLQILVGTHHVSQGRALLHHPVQGIQGDNTVRPAISYHNKYGGGRDNPPLGDGGGQG